MDVQRIAMIPNTKAPNGVSIPVHEHVKDLGVWMSSKGTFEYHINDVVQKASNPYQPTTPGLTRAAETNSIVDQDNYIEG